MGVIINRVYTRIGDDGTTSLAGGQKVGKNSARVEAFGSLDELNAILGLARELLADRDEGTRESRISLAGALLRRQHELFDLGAEMATKTEDIRDQGRLVGDPEIAGLEAEMDEVLPGLPPLRSFILPGGGLLAAQLHQARTVCRRAERRLVALHREEPQRPVVLSYINRLSDWLFVFARHASLLVGRPEVLWQPKGARER